MEMLVSVYVRHVKVVVRVRADEWEMKLKCRGYNVQMPVDEDRSAGEGRARVALERV